FRPASSGFALRSSARIAIDLLILDGVKNDSLLELPVGAHLFRSCLRELDRKHSVAPTIPPEEPVHRIVYVYSSVPAPDGRRTLPLPRAQVCHPGVPSVDTRLPSSAGPN